MHLRDANDDVPQHHQSASWTRHRGEASERASMPGGWACNDAAV